MKKITWIVISCLCVSLVAYGVLGFSDSSASAEISKETKGNFVRIEDGAKKLVITADGKETSYPLSATAWVYRNMSKATLAELQPGDSLDLILNSKEQAAYIKASSPQTAAAQPPAETGQSGGVTTPDSAGANGIAAGAEGRSGSAQGNSLSGQNGVTGPQYPGQPNLAEANGALAAGTGQSKASAGSSSTVSDAKQSSVPNGSDTSKAQQGAEIIGKLSLEWKSRELMLRIKSDRSAQGKPVSELYVQTSDKTVVHLTGESADAYIQLLIKGLPMERQSFEQSLKQRIAKEFQANEAKPEWKLDVEWKKAAPAPAASPDKLKGYEKEKQESSKDKEKDAKKDKDMEKSKNKGKEKDHSKYRDEDD